MGVWARFIILFKTLTIDLKLVSLLKINKAIISINLSLIHQQEVASILVFLNKSIVTWNQPKHF